MIDSTFEDVIQLDEEIVYPDNFNAITIEGTGDEAAGDVFKIVTLTLNPSTVTTDGVQTVRCTAVISDPANPTATVVALQTEEVSAPNPWEIPVGKIIQSLVGVWYDAGGGVKGTQIDSARFRVDRKGLVIIGEVPLTDPNVIVEYMGNDSISFSVGNPLLEILVEEGETSNVPEINGTFSPYDDPIINGNTISVDFTPELGAEGPGWITATYGNNFDSQLLTAISGAWPDLEIQAAAEPSSIAVDEESLITAFVSNGGKSVVGLQVEFFVRGGKGQVSPSRVTLTNSSTTEDGSSSRDVSGSTILSVSHPVISITSITNDADPAWVWDGTYTLVEDSLTRIVLSSTNGFEFEVMPFTIVYTAGGVAKTTFTSDTVTEDSAPVYVFAVCEDKSAMVSITVTATSATNTLILEADEYSLTYQEVTGVRAILSDPDTGAPWLDETIIISRTHGGGSISKTSGKTGTVSTSEDVTPSSVSEISVSKPIHSVESVTHDGTTYAVKEFLGTKITLDEPLPDLETTTVAYTYGGVVSLTFTAPASDDETHLVATHGSMLASITIETGAGNDDGASNSDQLTLNADPATIALNGTSDLTAELVQDDGSPWLGQTITFKIEHPSGYGTLDHATVQTVAVEYTEDVTSSDLKTLTVAHAIDSVTSVTHNGTPYTVASFEGKEITLVNELPDYEPTTVVYDGGGIAENVFTGNESFGEYVHITAEKGDLLASVMITCGDPDGVKYYIEVSGVAVDTAYYESNGSSGNSDTASSSKYWEITAVVTYGSDKAFAKNVIVVFNLEDPVYGALRDLEGTSDANGEVRVFFAKNAGASGTQTVKATIKNTETNATCDLELTVSSTSKKTYTYTMTVVDCKGVVTGADPDDKFNEAAVTWYKKVLVGGSTIVASFQCEVDRYGGFEDNPILSPLIIAIGLPHIVLPVSYSSKLFSLSGITQTSYNGGKYVPQISSDGLMELATSYYGIVPLQWEVNTADFNFPVTIKGSNGKAVSDADAVRVTIAGQSQLVVGGQAKFSRLPPGEHAVYINGSNYILNRKPAIYTPTAEWDLDTNNDTVTVEDYSEATYLVKDTEFQVTVVATLVSSELFDEVTYNGYPFSRSG